MLGETNLENIESGLVTIIRFLRSQPSVEYLIWFFNILRDPKRGGGLHAQNKPRLYKIIGKDNKNFFLLIVLLVIAFQVWMYDIFY